jgi:membrane fusion protein (multidrug efflux system)
VLTRQQAERLETLLSRQTASQAQYDAAFAALGAGEVGAERHRVDLVEDVALLDLAALLEGALGDLASAEAALAKAEAALVLTRQQAERLETLLSRQTPSVTRARPIRPEIGARTSV